MNTARMVENELYGMRESKVEVGVGTLIRDTQAFTAGTVVRYVWADLAINSLDIRVGSKVEHLGDVDIKDYLKDLEDVPDPGIHDTILDAGLKSGGGSTSASPNR